MRNNLRERVKEKPDTHKVVWMDVRREEFSLKIATYQGSGANFKPS
jgi:hypothetical protein